MYQDIHLSSSLQKCSKADSTRPNSARGQTFGVHIDCAGPPEPASAASPLPGSAEEPEGEEREEREEEAAIGFNIFSAGFRGLDGA